MTRKIWTRGLVCGALTMGMGCAGLVGNMVDSAANSSANAAGNQVGTQVGNQMVAQYSPMMNQMMTKMMFTYAFNGVGGYAVNESPYTPGQYTRWNIPREDEKPVTLERAYLAKDKDGNQWWKVKMTVPKDGSEEADAATADDTLIYEALFAPDGSKLLRLREKFPGDQEAKEVPVEEDTYGYAQPHKLTAQSLKGADKGVMSVTVPAGTFSAHHLVFAGYGNSDAEFWESSKVPGGTVKYGSVAQNGASSNGQAWMAELSAYGNDAKSELGSF